MSGFLTIPTYVNKNTSIKSSGQISSELIVLAPDWENSYGGRKKKINETELVA